MLRTLGTIVHVTKSFVREQTRVGRRPEITNAEIFPVEEFVSAYTWRKV